MCGLHKVEYRIFQNLVITCGPKCWHSPRATFVKLQMEGAVGEITNKSLPCLQYPHSIVAEFQLFCRAGHIRGHQLDQVLGEEFDRVFIRLTADFALDF